MGQSTALKTLPHNFYQSKGWHKSLVSHYCGEKVKPETLDYPLEALTVGIENIINVYGNFPEDVAKLLHQAVNAGYGHDEYEEKIYKVIKSSAIKRKDPYIDRVAEGLHYIRLLFEKNKEYIIEYFGNEIEKIEGATPEEKVEKLAEVLSLIAKIHTKQVAFMIMQYCDKKPN